MSLPQLRKRPLASLFAAAVFVAACAWASALLEQSDPDNAIARSERLAAAGERLAAAE